jgi:phosphoribosylformimino-5-aminoimidazole carboxamide ribotide isomerase
LGKDAGWFDPQAPSARYGVRKPQIGNVFQSTSQRVNESTGQPLEAIPSIDLRDGKVVRLAQGDYSAQTTYGDDPAEVARTFESAGASWIHVVDLDAARSKYLDARVHAASANAKALAAIRGAVRASLEVGGGARDEAAVRRLLDWGATRVVVGSAALRDWAWFKQLSHRADLAGRIVLGMDARGGRLAAHGWTDQTDASAVEVASRTRGWPLAGIVFTDIDRDGMLQGVNAEATGAVLAATDVPIIASGGVAGLEDVRRCAGIGCAGVIIGRAYYEGRIDLAEAVRLARRAGAAVR